MDIFFNVDWKGTFIPTIALAEVILRGSLVYLCVFALLRLVLRREVGTVGMADLLLMVLIADAASNAMASQYKSVPEGMVLVATLIFWNYSFDWLGYRFPRLERFLHPPPLPLVKDGRPLWRNLRRERVTQEELMTRLRQEGLDDLAQVKTACLEGDGRISVIKRTPQSDPGESEETPSADNQPAPNEGSQPFPTTDPQRD